MIPCHSFLNTFVCMGMRARVCICVGWLLVENARIALFICIHTSVFTFVDLLQAQQSQVLCLGKDLFCHRYIYE